MPGAEPLKVGEGFTANPEPSPRNREGVETGRAASKAALSRDDEGTVQTTNPSGAAKAEVVRKSVSRKGVGVQVPSPAPVDNNARKARRQRTREGACEDVHLRV